MQQFSTSMAGLILVNRGRFSPSVLIAVVTLLSFTALPTFGQLNLQCPSHLLTIAPNGSINFAPLSEGSGLVDASYVPGIAAGWYALANGFVDTVRPGGLPYGESSIPLYISFFIAI